uniref:Adhesion G protein-coupled receptor F7 n=1 Tax=Oryzias melastigma TaxID=30732 RepID=A0A3B3C008_ORYME
MQNSRLRCRDRNLNGSRRVFKQKKVQQLTFWNGYLFKNLNSSFNSINGNVALIQSSGEITNISIRFEVFDDTLQNPKCVFWNFNLLDGLGGWDDDGCFVVLRENKAISCSCNHLTSLSILMSAYSPNLFVLDLITYIGLGISIGSLVITVIIEAIMLNDKSNISYIRHISLFNSALSLLIANICFLLGVQISEEMENTKACIAITFFTHFFYLAMFFWMLGSALLLLYRTFAVGDDFSLGVWIGFKCTLGYGGPLIIAAITYAVTAPKEEYVRGHNICWLNWEESKALLAFVIPVIVIVFINLIILTVVLYKMFKRRKTNSTNMVDSNSAVVFTKAVTVLTSLFGINWIVGIGTIVFPTNKGIHIASTLLFSLQENFHFLLSFSKIFMAVTKQFNFHCSRA